METKDPKWEHETVVLKIGEHDYTFTSLSLYSVWKLWPSLHAVKDMALRGRPLAMMEHAKEILNWIAPLLMANEADCKAFTQDHANVLIDFYRMKHDWARMATLGRQTTKTEGDGDEKTEEEKHQVFVAVIAAGAQYAGMDMAEFVQRRFEFCADSIQGAYASLRRAESEEADDGRSHSWREATMKLAATFGAKPEFVPEEKQPDWMKAMSRVKVN